VDGVGDVSVGGSSLPAVRVELNPTALFKYGIGLEDVRAALSAANATVQRCDREHACTGRSTATTARTTAAEYRSLVVAYRNGSAVRLTISRPSPTPSKTRAISGSRTARLR